MNEESIEASKAPLIDHFIELRTRILSSIFILSVTFIFAFIFSENIYLFLVNPYEEIIGSSTTNLGLNFSKHSTTAAAADSEYNTPTFTAEMSKSSKRDSICSLTSFLGKGNTSLIPVVF